MLKSIKNRLKTFIFWNRFLMYKILQKKTVFFNLFSKILCFIKKKKKTKLEKQISKYWLFAKTGTVVFLQVVSCIFLNIGFQVAESQRRRRGPHGTVMDMNTMLLLRTEKLLFHRQRSGPTEKVQCLCFTRREERRNWRGSYATSFVVESKRAWPLETEAKTCFRLETRFSNLWKRRQKAFLLAKRLYRMLRLTPPSIEIDHTQKDRSWITYRRFDVTPESALQQRNSWREMVSCISLFSHFNFPFFHLPFDCQETKENKWMKFCISGFQEMKKFIKANPNIGIRFSWAEVFVFWVPK